MLAEYIDHMNNDLTVINAARVSFNSASAELKEKDIGLINFLARGCSSKEWQNHIDDLYELCMEPNDIDELLHYVKAMPTHWTPFSHAQITMRETVPIFIARQRFKHMVGFTYNEVTRRYVDDEPEFHIPSEWRSRPDKSIKQGSGDDIIYHLKGDGSDFVGGHYQEFIGKAKELYQRMLESGIAPEQARMVLPQSMLTSYWVTGSLYAWARAYIQRSDDHAQLEIQELAAQWQDIIQPLFPHSWNALTQARRFQ